MQEQIGMRFIAETGNGGSVKSDPILKCALQFSRGYRNIFLSSENIAECKADEGHILLSYILHHFIFGTIHDEPPDLPIIKKRQWHIIMTPLPL